MKDSKNNTDLNLVKIFGCIVFFVIICYLCVFWLIGPNGIFLFPIKGLDVSNHQGDIDWSLVPDDYEFVIVKATEGDDFVDKSYLLNAEKIKATSRLLGAYHFFHFNYKGKHQAENFITTVKDSIDIPPIVDVEFSGNTAKYNISEIKQELHSFIDILENYYQTKVIIYTTANEYYKIISGEFDNPVWYRSILHPVNPTISNVQIWQVNDRKRIDGIETFVDVNFAKSQALDFLLN